MGTPHTRPMHLQFVEPSKRYADVIVLRHPEVGSSYEAAYYLDLLREDLERGDVEAARQLAGPGGAQDAVRDMADARAGQLDHPPAEVR